MADSSPSSAQASAIEAFADAVYELMSKRAASWGVLDVEIQTEDWLVEGELLFDSGVDMGFSYDARQAQCRYCVLPSGDADPVWLDADASDLQVLQRTDPDSLAEPALALCNGLLAARRAVSENAPD